jgi:hypothetical protein
LGDKTSKTTGIKKAVAMARENETFLLQIKVVGTNPTRVADAGVLYDWTWDNLKKVLK